MKLALVETNSRRKNINEKKKTQINKKPQAQVCGTVRRQERVALFWRAWASTFNDVTIELHLKGEK